MDPTDTSLDRRELLRAGIASGTALLAGCSGSGSDSDGGDSETTTADETAPSSETQTPTPTTEATTESPTPDRPGFFDDFEDGDYTTAPVWQSSVGPEVGTVEVVDREGPDGGTKALRISDATDDELNERGESARVRLADPVEGWQGAWTFEGQFYAAAVPDGENADDVHVAVGLYNSGIELLLNPRVELLFFESEGDSDVETRESILEEGEWYAYELAHDGTGTYTAARWPASGDREDGLSVTAEREPPTSPTEQPTLVTYGGYPEFIDQEPPSPRPEPGSIRLTADHSYVRWRPATEQNQ